MCYANSARFEAARVESGWQAHHFTITSSEPNHPVVDETGSCVVCSISSNDPWCLTSNLAFQIALSNNSMQVPEGPREKSEGRRRNGTSAAKPRIYITTREMGWTGRRRRRRSGLNERKQLSDWLSERGREGERENNTKHWWKAFIAN